MIIYIYEIGDSMIIVVFVRGLIKVGFVIRLVLGICVFDVVV